MPDPSRQGGCECGAVRYEVTAAPGPVSLCHCHQCRRLHGSPGAFTRVAREDFGLTEDRGLKWHQSSEKGWRGFCGTCGSALFASFQDDPLVYFTPGSLDDDSGIVTARHIFVAHRGRSYEIADDLPRFDAYD